MRRRRSGVAGHRPSRVSWRSFLRALQSDVCVAFPAQSSGSICGKPGSRRAFGARPDEFFANQSAKFGGEKCQGAQAAEGEGGPEPGICTRHFSDWYAKLLAVPELVVARPNPAARPVRSGIYELTNDNVAALPVGNSTADHRMLVSTRPVSRYGPATGSNCRRIFSGLGEAARNRALTIALAGRRP
jgi:hypothetical protein